MPDNLPEKIRSMKESGIPPNNIRRNLESQGFSSQEMMEAISQSQLEPVTESPELQAAPIQQTQPTTIEQAAQYPTYPTAEGPPPEEFAQEQMQRQIEETIHQIAESIIKEKWDKLIEDIGDLAAWKDHINIEISSIKQEILRFESRFDALQRTMISRVQDYDKSMHDVGIEIKALEKVLQRIISPLSSNIKELQSITKDLKKKK